jgi:Asp/Glu/hydantoin racemase
MATTARVGLLHTGAVVIPPVMELMRRYLPDAVPINYLDDRIVADLADPPVAESVPARVVGLARAAADAGATAIMLTCSSISQLAAPTAATVGVPVLRIDEAMADEAVRTGSAIVVLATLPTTCAPTTALIHERAALAGLEVSVASRVVDGAFAAVTSGDRYTHDQLIRAAIEQDATAADVIVLAQASMASAAPGADVTVPVLSSLESGVQRLRDLVTSGAR